jgi:hypothetical protein
VLHNTYSAVVAVLIKKKKRPDVAVKFVAENASLARDNILKPKP